jgi:hypothetical protein
MILGFKKKVYGRETNFKEKILEGNKIHTIREDSKNRWRRGKMIHFCYGVRTKKYENFKQSLCTGYQKIRITHHVDGMNIVIFVDNRKLETKEIYELSANDGFEDICFFLEWFREDFSGKIIHWTDKRY